MSCTAAAVLANVEEPGVAGRAEEGHFAPLWSPADYDRLLGNVTLPVLWGRGEGIPRSCIVLMEAAGRRLGPVVARLLRPALKLGVSDASKASDADSRSPFMAATLCESAAEGGTKRCWVPSRGRRK